MRVTSPKASQTTHYDTETKSATIPTASSSVASSKVEELTAASSPERIHKQRRPSSRLKETGIEIEKPVEEKPPFSLDSLVDQFCFDLDAGHKILEDARISDNQQKQTTTRTRKEPDGQGSKDSKDSNEELRQLIVRWKEAGRLAADELYSIISDRVTAVGGVKAWRAMSLSQPQEDSIISQKNARRRRRSREDDGGENDGQDEEENDYEDEEEKDEETDDKAEESQVSLALPTNIYEIYIY